LENVSSSQKISLKMAPGLNLEDDDEEGEEEEEAPTTTTLRC